jgi:hypothetical protein
MIARPTSNEWDLSRLPADRLAYLACNLSFEEIVEHIVADIRILRSTVKPYGTPTRADARDARQVIFVVDVGAKACDLFYNAPDGLRARYWQSPDLGFCATRHLLDRLLSPLIAFAEDKRADYEGKAVPMTLHDVCASLKGHSAKVWPLERDGKNILLLEPEPRSQLVVSRWKTNEEHAQFNKGMWRRTPTGGALEIKGALLSPDGTEHVPPGKKDRSCQIHHYGFT